MEGRSLFEDPAAVVRQHALRQELLEVMRRETSLDDLIQTCSAQLKEPLYTSPHHFASTLPTLAYVTYQDICSVGSFKDQTVIAVKAPPETRLEVPDIIDENLQIYLKSTNGPIEVYLCPEEVLEESSPGKSSTPKKPQRGSAVSKPVAVTSLLDCEDGVLGLPHNLLQQTEDQLPSSSYSDTPFVSFSPTLDREDYLWSLEDGEGVSDLFDSYDLDELLQN
uniref:Transcription factor E2F2-like n=1 Tax=Callorhinchus milii TaxID=7868 RepID=A0A4W3JSV5_CALMI